MRFSKRFSRVMAMMLTVMLVVGSFPAQNVLAAEPDATEETAVQEDAAQSEETDDGEDSAESADDASDDVSDVDGADDEQDAEDPADSDDTSDDDADAGATADNDSDDDSEIAVDDDNDADNEDDAGQNDEIEADDSISDNEAEESVSDDAAEAVSDNEAEVLKPDMAGTGLTLDGNGGKVRNGYDRDENYNYIYTNTYTVGSPTTSLYSYEPEWEGYWFTGWYSEKACTTKLSQDSNKNYLKETPAAGSTIYAGWEDACLLDANGGQFSVYDSNKQRYVVCQTHYLGEKTTYLGDSEYKPTRNGYYFTGWYAEPECVTRLSSESDDYYLENSPESGTTIYAGWSNDYASVTCIIGDDAYYSGVYSDYKNVHEVTVQVPRNKAFAANQYLPQSYNITCNDKHYVFDHWGAAANDDKEVSFKVSEDVTWYAVYDSRVLLTLNANTDKGGYYTEYADGKYTKVATRTEICDKNLQKTVYSSYVPQNSDGTKKFVGWFKDPECTDPVEKSGNYYYINMGTADVTIYADWEEDTSNPVLTLDPNVDGGYFFDYDTVYERVNELKFSCTEGETFDKYIYNPVHPDQHYQFMGWYSDKECTKQVAAATKDGNYYNSQTEVKYKVDANTTLYAKWEKKYKVVTFDANGGYYRYYDGNSYVENADKVTFRVGLDGKLSRYPDDPEIDDLNKTFEGWYAGNTKISSLYNYSFTADTTVKAKYTECYAVTLNYNGGYYKVYENGKYVHKTGSRVLRVPKGESIRYSAYIEDACYEDDEKTFMGWYLSTDTDHINAISTYSYVPQSDVEIVAWWADKYTVTFNSGEGTFVGGSKSKSYKATEGTVYGDNSSAVIPDEPTINNNDKVFDGWYLNDVKVAREDILNTVVTGDVTYTAKYVDAYIVTFNPNGGSFVSKTADSSGNYSVKVIKNESLRGKVPTVKSADETHTVFDGWFRDSACTQAVDPYSTVIDGPVTLYAGWTECYVLTFHTNYTGALFANGKETMDVKVVKGTPYRYGEDYGSNKTGKASANSAPEIMTVPKGAFALPYWYDAPACTSGTRYFFDQHNSHMEIYDSGTWYWYSGYDNYFSDIYGFIPTGDMDLYAKVVTDTVNLTFSANGKKFSEDYECYGFYEEWQEKGYTAELSSDRTKWIVTVPKGINYGAISEPYGFEGSGYSYSWAFKESSCTNRIYDEDEISKNTTVYVKWYSGSSSSGSSLYVNLHSGEGYFGSSKSYKTEDMDYTLSKSNWRNINYIPSIDDAGRAFSGYYYDAELTKRYEYQRWNGREYEMQFPAKVTDLYAAYGDAYTVRFDANGGYFDEDYDRTKDPDANLRETTVLTAKSYPGQPVVVSDYTKRVRRDGSRIFEGWYTDKGCTERASVYSISSYQGEFYNPKGDVTLYAKWIDYEKANSIEATVDGKTAVTIDIGESKLLAATVSPTGIASDVHWVVSGYSISNSNEDYPVRLDVATGKVTGLAAGKCYIYAEMNGVRSKTLTVTVTSKTVTSSISVTDEDGNPFSGAVGLYTGASFVIKGQITPEDSADSLAGSVVWKSSDTSVVEVIATGDGRDALVTAVGKGDAVITATLGNKSVQVNVHVADPVSFGSDTLIMTALEGASQTVNVTVPETIGTATLSVGAYVSSEGVTPSGYVNIAKGAAETADGQLTVPVTVTLTDAGLAITSTQQIFIIATVTADGETYSDVCTLELNEQKHVGTVTASIADDTEVSKGQKVLLYCDTQDADIYYTTDGTAPTVTENNLYTDAIIINGTTTIKAMAVKTGLRDSAVYTFEYTVTDWGDADEYKGQFDSNISNVPDDIWYVIGGRVYAEYPENGVTDFEKTYTGSKVTFNDQIKVFIGTTKLIENRDYTVSYGNNTNALTAGAVNPKTNKSIAPYVTVKGKGSYSKSAVFRFTITTEDIDNAVIASESIVPVAYGKSVKLGNTKPKVTYAGKTLTLNKDYVLEYYRNTVEDENQVADPAKELLTEPGAKYIIRVVAKEGGNFAGDMDATVTVVVIDGKDKSYVKTSTLKVGNEKGQAIKLPYFEDAPEELAVYYKADGSVDFEKLFDNSSDEKIPYAFVYAKKPAEPLTYGVDYTVEAATCKDAGKYTFVIKGVEKDAPGEGEIQYTGSKTAALEITGTAISKTKIAGLVTTVEYTGAPIDMADIYNAGDKVIIAQNNAADTDPYPGYTGVKWSGVTLYTTFTEKVDKKNVTRYRALTEGVDYTVSCENTGVVGKFTLTFTGKGRYTGVISKTITVKAYNLNDTKKANLIRVTVDNENVQYSKTGAKPAVTVRYGDTVLREGIDYTVTYKNNAKIVADYTQLKESARPTVIVKGKGNYAGSSAAMEGAYFNIVRADVTEAVTLSVSDVVRNPKGKSGYFFVTPKLMDGGKAVTAGKNKDVDAIAKTDYAYYYAEDTVLLDDTRKYAGEAISATDALPDNTLIRVTVKVTISDAEKGSKIRTAESPYKATGAGNSAVLEGYYRFLGEGKDISKMSVSFVKGKTYTFHNGDDVVPVKTEDILISYKTKDANGKTVTEFLEANDFEIASISQNRFLGTATVTLRGKGDFGGCKILKFKVNAKSV